MRKTLISFFIAAFLINPVLAEEPEKAPGPKADASLGITHDDEWYQDQMRPECRKGYVPPEPEATPTHVTEEEKPLGAHHDDEWYQKDLRPECRKDYVPPPTLESICKNWGGSPQPTPDLVSNYKESTPEELAKAWIDPDIEYYYPSPKPTPIGPGPNASLGITHPDSWYQDQMRPECRKDYVPPKPKPKPQQSKYYDNGSHMYYLLNPVAEPKAAVKIRVRRAPLTTAEKKAIFLKRHKLTEPVVEYDKCGNRIYKTDPSNSDERNKLIEFYEERRLQIVAQRDLLEAKAIEEKKLWNRIKRTLTPSPKVKKAIYCVTCATEITCIYYLLATSLTVLVNMVG